MGKNAKHYIGGIIGADPLVSSAPRPGVSNLGALGGDNSAAGVDTFATFDATHLQGGSTLSSDLLTVDFGTTNHLTPSTLSMSSGKYYAEFRMKDFYGSGTSTYPYAFITVGSPPAAGGTANQYQAAIFSTNNLSYTKTQSATSATTTPNYHADLFNSIGDIVGVAVDADTGTAWFSINGIWQKGADPDNFADGSDANYISTGMTGPLVFSCADGSNSGPSDNPPIKTDITANFGQNDTFNGDESAGAFTDANGLGKFQYEPPAGFVGLYTTVTTTRPTRRWGGMTGRSLVVSTADTPAFNAVTYTGSSSAQDVTVGFQPDFAWIKCRNDNISHSVWDSVRGADKLLAADTTATETTLTNTVVTDADGMTLYGAYSRINSSTNGRTYVAWAWKAGGAPTSSSSTTNGSAMVDGVAMTTDSIATAASASITPTKMSVNTDAGFSIVQYTGTGSAATIPHGLNSAPEFVMCKTLDTANQWHCGHTALGWNSHIHLDLTNAASGTSTAWNNTAPNSSVVNLGASTGSNSGGRMAAYCWHSVPGFSKIGSYSGSGSSGNKVTTGFQPAFVMIKSTGSNNWVMIDNARSPTNPADELLYANSSGQEPTPSTATSVNFLADGFDFGGGGGSINGTSTTYIYLAFAEGIPGADALPATGVLSLAEQYQGKL